MVVGCDKKVTLVVLVALSNSNQINLLPPLLASKSLLVYSQ